MQDFNNKVAVVTGGASGVGKAISELLASLGVKVVVSDIEVKALESTVAGIVEKGGEAITCQADVTSPESMQNLVDVSLEKYGEINLVFANAGVGTGEGGPMWEYNLNDWEWGFKVNTWGLIHSINAFLPVLVKQNTEAHFVITGSGNGAFLMLPNTPIYTASKAAVQAITENLHYQLQMAQSPVKVNALFPGPHVVNSGIFNSERNRPEDLPEDPDKQDSGIHSVEDMRNIMKQHGMELKTTEPEEVAHHAIDGIRADKFWISPRTEKATLAFKARVESILTGATPTPPNIL